jgi:hypothetical protein
MSAQHSPSRRSTRRGNRAAGQVPGDPRYAATTLTATASEMSCLGKKVFLSTAVLDCIIQCTTPSVPKRLQKTKVS